MLLRMTTRSQTSQLVMFAHVMLMTPMFMLPCLVGRMLVLSPNKSPITFQVIGSPIQPTLFLLKPNPTNPVPLECTILLDVQQDGQHFQARITKLLKGHQSSIDKNQDSTYNDMVALENGEVTAKLLLAKNINFLIYHQIERSTSGSWQSLRRRTHT